MWIHLYAVVQDLCSQLSFSELWTQKWWLHTNALATLPPAQIPATSTRGISPSPRMYEWIGESYPRETRREKIFKKCSFLELILLFWMLKWPSVSLSVMDWTFIAGHNEQRILKTATTLGGGIRQNTWHISSLPPTRRSCDGRRLSSSSGEMSCSLH